MTPQQWHEVKRLFEEAVDLSESDRARLLDKACADRPTLRREVDELLAADVDTRGDLSRPVGEVARGLGWGSAMDLQAGQMISHYRIEGRLGAGGMGVVYSAEDVRLKRKVALKFLLRDATQDDEASVRFMQEAQAASALDHPNVCTIYEIDQTEGAQLFLAMALYEGETVAKKLFSGGLDTAEAVDIARQSALGLAKAHERGIVHRDVKPVNLFVTTDGVVKVLDFGIAKLAGSAQVTKTGHVVGTIDFLAPEAARGRQVDGRADIWSLGVVLYEMLTGQKPFSGDQPAAVLRSILEDEPRPLHQLSPDLPNHLEAVVSRALAKDPALRYQTMRELHADLTLESGAEIRSQERSAATAGVASIAVLPFADMSVEADQEYFCDGIAEELISVLGKIPGLRVVSRTSSFQFKGKETDLVEIGQRLKVAKVLEGSVRRSGDRIRISVRLVAVRDSFEIWSCRYDRRLEDVFSIQDEIAGTVAEKLKHKLVARSTSRGTPATGEDLEAYNLYLQGRYHWNKRTHEGLRKSVEFFERTLSKNPRHAKTLAALADSYVLLGIYGWMPPDRAMPQATKAALEALDIDDTLGPAYAALACVKSVYWWSWEAAEKDFERAIEFDPGYATAHHWYAVNYLTLMRRFREAVARLETALSLDPLSLPIGASLGIVRYYAGEYDAAVVAYRRALELDPRFDVAHYFLGQALLQLGKPEQAIDELRQAIRLSEGKSLEMEAALGHAYATVGDHSAALRHLEGLEAQAVRGYVSPAMIAQIRVGLGEVERALDDLEQAFEERSPDLAWVGLRPAFRPLRNEERFVDLLARLGLPDPSPERSVGSQLP